MVYFVRDLKKVVYRECKHILSNPIYVFIIIIAPLITSIFFISLLHEGSPRELPIGVVDLDNSATSRTFVRTLDGFSQTKIIAQYNSISEARRAMQRGDTYGFFYIPSNFVEDAIAMRRPTVSFYTNDSYLVASSLVYSDMKMISELANGYAMRYVLRKKGLSEDIIQPLLQPIVIEMHGLKNPSANYAVYLCNAFVPGVFLLLIFMATVYSIGTEIKYKTAMDWLRKSKQSMSMALIGKLLPQTLLFSIVFNAYNFVLYGFLHYPCNCNYGTMFLGVTMTIMACQGLGTLMFAILPTLRLSLSFASLWGIVSLSIAGISFPLLSMYPPLQSLANLFPLRHYFLIYSDQALNGYGIIYSWQSFFALFCFMLLPFLVKGRIKNSLVACNYRP